MDNSGGLTKQIGAWMTQHGHTQRLAAGELSSNGPGFAVRHTGAPLE